VGHLAQKTEHLASPGNDLGRGRTLRGEKLGGVRWRGRRRAPNNSQTPRERGIEDFGQRGREAQSGISATKMEGDGRATEKKDRKSAPKKNTQKNNEGKKR